MHADVAEGHSKIYARLDDCMFYCFRELDSHVKCGHTDNQTNMMNG